MPDSLDLLFSHFRTTRDPESLARVFELTAPVLVRQAKRMVGSTSAAEDVVQELFVSLLRGSGKYDATRPCLPFLRGALHRQALRAIETTSRHRRRKQRPSPPIDPATLAAATDLQALVRARIAAIDPPYREVLQRVLVDGRTPQETSTLLGRPLATIRVQLHRGLARLREMLPPTLTLAALLLLPRRGRASAPRAARWSVPTLGVAAAAMAAVLMTPPAPEPTCAAVAPIVTTSAVAASAAVTAAAVRQAVPQQAEAPTVLEVRVVDPAGQPVESVGVRAYAAGTSPDSGCRTAITDRRGVATLVDLGLDRVRIDLDRGWHGEFDTRRQSAIRAELAPGILVAGSVEDPDGRPIPHASIWLCHHRDDWTEGQVVATADATGRFELCHVPAETAIAATAPGFAWSFVTPVETASDNMRLRLDCEGRRVAGRVDGPPGPIADALVLLGERPRASLTAPRSMRGFRPTLAVRTNADGTFVADHLPPGPIELVAMARGCTPLHRSLDASDLAGSAVLHLRPGCSRRGRVTDGHGRTLADAVVTMRGQAGQLRVQSHAADDGSFLLEGCDPAWRTISARTDFGVASIDVGSDPDAIVLTMAPPATVPGRLLLGDDRMPAGQWDLCCGATEMLAQLRRIPVDGDGRFFCPQPLPDHRFFARLHGTRAWTVCQAQHAADGIHVHVAPGAARSTVVRLHPSGFTPAERGDLRVHVRAGDIAFDAATTDRGDAIELEALPQQRWRIVVSGSTGVCPPIDLGTLELTAATLVLPVTMPPIGWLCWRPKDTVVHWCRLTDPQGLQTHVASATGRIALPVGEWRLATWSASAWANFATPVTIRAGEQTWVEGLGEPLREVELAFRVPADVRSCRVEVRTPGTEPPRQQPLLRRLPAEGLTPTESIGAALCALPPGNHELHVFDGCNHFRATFRVTDGGGARESIFVPLVQLGGAPPGVHDADAAAAGDDRASNAASAIQRAR